MDEDLQKICEEALHTETQVIVKEKMKWHLLS